MTGLSNGRPYECIVIDLNTQMDFCGACGAFPVANLKTLLPALRNVVAWVKRNGAPVVSTVESRRQHELSDSGFPIHCIDGSGGQRKLDFTVFRLRANVEVDTTLAVPADPFQDFQQVIFRKRSDDLLTNPKADRLLTHLPVREYILFGIGTELSVKALALGLLAREKRVAVVVDACGYWHKSAADLALRQVAAKGAELITVCDLRSRLLDPADRRRYRSIHIRRNGSNGRNDRNGDGARGNGSVDSGNGRVIDVHDPNGRGPH